jgi:hypothetical protein
MTLILQNTNEYVNCLCTVIFPISKIKHPILISRINKASIIIKVVIIQKKSKQMRVHEPVQSKDTLERLKSSFWKKINNKRRLLKSFYPRVKTLLERLLTFCF